MGFLCMVGALEDKRDVRGHAIAKKGFYAGYETIPHLLDTEPASKTS